MRRRRRVRRLGLCGVGTALVAIAAFSVVVPAAASGGSTVVVPLAPAPWQPGDLVWTSDPPVTELSALSNGCQRVPATGYIGSGVYARTTTEYSVFWSWSAGSASQPFHWWIFNAAGTVKASGSSGGGGGSASVTAANHYWKVRNDGSTPQAWNVCWND